MCGTVHWYNCFHRYIICLCATVKFIHLVLSLGEHKHSEASIAAVSDDSTSGDSGNDDDSAAESDDGDKAEGPPMGPAVADTWVDRLRESLSTTTPAPFLDPAEFIKELQIRVRGGGQDPCIKVESRKQALSTTILVRMKHKKKSLAVVPGKDLPGKGFLTAPVPAQKAIAMPTMEVNPVMGGFYSVSCCWCATVVVRHWHQTLTSWVLVVGTSPAHR